MKNGLRLCSLVLLVACAFMHTRVEAQVFSNEASVTISRNTTLTVKGSIENEGTIVNDGQLKVSGQWINSGTYEPRQGEITFNGSSTTVPQIIHHNGQPFHRVTISGGTKKIILSDVFVQNQIRFDHGIVEASGDSRIVFESGAKILNASDSSHVHGVVFQKGSGYKLFPIGNGSVYLPVELPDVQDPSAVIGVLALQFSDIGRMKTSAFASISEKRYWQVDVESGSLPNSQIVLPLRDESWAANPEQIVVVQSESPTQEFTSIGKSSFTGDPDNARVKSQLNISMPFVALATVAQENELVVYNAVSNNGDHLNEFLRIENIENFPVNRFSVFNRWGDKIFEVENYDNAGNVFDGYSNISGKSELVSGTYFYVLEIPGRESLRGFISVKN